MKYTFNKKALLEEILALGLPKGLTEEILALGLPKGLTLTIVHKCKGFGLDKVLINSNHGIQIVSRYKAEYHKNRFTGRYNKTNILNGDWLKVDAEYNGLQVIDLRE